MTANEPSSARPGKHSAAEGATADQASAAGRQGLPDALVEPKAATAATRASQDAVRAYLPFDDERSFAAAKRGFLGTIEPLRIERAPGARPVYDLSGFGFLDGPAPDTVNPSLWRQAQLNAHHAGLFEVVDGIYQVRSFDLANMTLVRGEHGWIVIDPLTATETAAAALKLANDTLGERPVVAVIHTHSHVDHFAGVLGVTSHEEVASGAVQVIAPLDFVEESLAENVLAGNVMNRRATYMYGNLLAPSPTGFVSCGLGANLALGTTGFVMPTHIIRETGETRTIDGIEIEFQMTMGTEAPAEMVFYFPQFKALCMSEITSHHLHNVYTPRGAQVRDALAWASQIDESIELFGARLEVQFASHHWPTWGRAEAVDYLEKQRDLYKFIHDQTLRLANHGYTREEIAARLRLPDSLGKEFFNRDYYGTLNHNVRAVYVRYLGEFSGNPSLLNPLPPTVAGGHYVDFMGGPDAVVEKARNSFENNDYQWVCEVLQHVVNVAPDHVEARALLADSLEQLGYQAESGPWRNFYLCGALELRHGVPAGSKQRISVGVLDGMPLADLFKALAVRLNAERADGVALALNLRFTDGEPWLLEIRHSVLNAWRGRESDTAHASLSVTKGDFKRLMTGHANAAELLGRQALSIDGDAAALASLADLFDQFDRRFPIMTPRPK
ncbi:MAG: alkyl sulfatase dimerization domain-containing protein [Pseudomonadota bacterium]